MAGPVPWNDSATVVQVTFGAGEAELSPTVVFEGKLRDAAKFIKVDKCGASGRYRIGLPDRHSPPFEYQGGALEALLALIR